MLLLRPTLPADYEPALIDSFLSEMPPAPIVFAPATDDLCVQRKMHDVHLDESVQTAAAKNWNGHRHRNSCSPSAQHWAVIDHVLIAEENYMSAIDCFRQLQDWPGSLQSLPLRQQAAYNEAVAWRQMSDFGRAVLMLAELLGLEAPDTVGQNAPPKSSSPSKQPLPEAISLPARFSRSQPYCLFVSKRGNGIYARSTPRRNQARQKRRSGEHKRSDSECRGIEWAYVEQLS
jgi:hypothetical protein